MKKRTPSKSVPSRVSIPKIAVTSIEEAEQVKSDLESLRIKLCRFIARESRKQEAPAVKMLNSHLAKGELLYCEYHHSDGISRSVYNKKSYSFFRSRSNSFSSKDNGIVFCGMCDDPKRYYAIDRVYKLSLDGPSELLYERARR